jgi:hypothetical protein
MLKNQHERLTFDKFGRLIQQNMQKGRTSMLADFISPWSVEELNKRVKAGDHDAMLKLGDCHFYGLKSLPRNEEKAKTLYENAAVWGSPEGATQCAMVCYWEMLVECGLKEDVSIPGVLENTPRMWQYLEMAGEADFVSMFTTQMVMKTGSSWMPSPSLKSKVTQALQGAGAPVPPENKKNSTSLNARRSLVFDKLHDLSYHFHKPDMCYAYFCKDISVYEHFLYADMMSELKLLLNLVGDEPNIPKGYY